MFDTIIGSMTLIIWRWNDIWGPRYGGKKAGTLKCLLHSPTVGWSLLTPALMSPATGHLCCCFCCLPP